MPFWKSVRPISNSTPGGPKEAPVTGEDWLAARVRATPEAIALFIGGDSWSYAELDQLVDLSAHNLLRHATPGERLALLLPSGLAFVCLVHAAARIGVPLVPLNSRLTTEELTWQVNRTDCGILVYDRGTANQAAALGQPERKLIPSENLFNERTRLKNAEVTPFNMARVQSIIFTSGTSGKPKGAMLTFANHFYGATASAFRLGVLPSDRWLCCLPLYHVGGLAIILRSCLYGTAVVLHERFDEVAVSDSLDRHQISLISLVPTMLRRLLRYREGRAWPSSLRHILVGGAAMSDELMRASQASGAPVSTTYGLTEATSQVATMLPEQAMTKPGSVGRPLLFTTVTIVGDDGRLLPPGEVGEITVKGPTIMQGYFGDEEYSRKALRDGQLFTGDVGYLDADGDLWVLQRRLDIIVSGGENVYPAEVEAVLRRHPAVEEACVVGLHSEEWGQQVAAAIVPSGTVPAEPADILAFCRQHLAGYKLPRQLVIVPTLPRTSSGKVQRPAVIEMISARARS